MVNTIYFAKSSKETCVLCLIDYQGRLLGNAQVPIDELELYISLFEDHLDKHYSNKLETKIKELTFIKYEKLLNKSIKDLEGTGLKRETLEGYDPSNEVKNWGIKDENK